MLGSVRRLEMLNTFQWDFITGTNLFKVQMNTIRAILLKRLGMGMGIGMLDIVKYSGFRVTRKVSISEKDREAKPLYYK